MSDEQIGEYEFKEGTLYVKTHRSKLSVEGPWNERRVDATAVLHVSSSPAFKWLEADGALVIRGRKYRVHTGRIRTTEEYTKRSGLTTQWRADGNLSFREFLNDNGVPVTWDTATYTRLDAMVSEACDKYVADFPGWEEHCLRLAIDSEVDRNEGKIRELREELDKYTGRRDRFAALLELRQPNAGHISINDLDGR
jgi:hypothetical protein